MLRSPCLFIATHEYVALQAHYGHTQVLNGRTAILYVAEQDVDLLIPHSNEIEF